MIGCERWKRVYYLEQHVSMELERNRKLGSYYGFYLCVVASLGIKRMYVLRVPNESLGCSHIY
jgi:hypothetical protein